MSSSQNTVPERRDESAQGTAVQESQATYAPVLLLQLQDDLSRSRKREAFWISLVVHIVVILAVLNMPDLTGGSRGVLLQSPDELVQNREHTFLELPPDVQEITRRPDPKVLSDKDRIASSRNPTVDRKTMEEILDARRPGPPEPPAPQSLPSQPQQAPSPPPMVAEARPEPSPGRGAGAAPQATAPQNRESEAPRLESIQEAARQVMGGGLAGSMSPGQAIQEAARASAGSRTGGSAGDYGMRPPGANAGVKSHLDILSDTMGVDFGPYLTRVLHSVRLNWYNLIPEVARAPLMKQGKVSVEFAITRDGKVAGMRLSESSGDVALDRAAWGGITASNPFPQLPNEFRGSYLALRFHFYYNPDRSELR